MDPDLFLSLGRGENRITVLQKLSDRPKEFSISLITTRPSEPTLEARRAAGKRRAKVGDNIPNAEIAWTAFKAFAVQERVESKWKRFIR